MSAPAGALCSECGSPLATDQHYCLACGARVGGASPQLLALLQRIHDAARDHAGEPVRPPRARPVAGGLTLPTAKVSAVLVMMFLGFGVLIGDVAARHVDTALAASRRLKVMLPAPKATASAAAPASTETSVSEPPQAQAEPTPAPPAATPAAAPASAKPSGGAATPAPAASEKPAPKPSTKLPAIKHVFVLMLSDEPYAAAFGPESSAHYLSQTLEHKGSLLVHYDAVAHEQLANEIALLSGQGPTLETAANCPLYADIAPTGSGADEQVLGNGCVYPASTQTLPGQLSAKHLRWRAYVEGIDEAGDTSGACGHPQLGAADPTAEQASSSGPYATFRNPFVYFQSLSGSPNCAADDVGLNELKTDLAAAKDTPSLSYIVPDRCHDGNPTPCTAGAPAGLAPADALLEKVVPEILAAKAYKENGLLVITVDEAPSSGEFADSSSCCGQPTFPNVPASSTALTPRGGGSVGALLLSPFIKHAVTDQESYDHFSLLRTIEDLFGLKHLGYAGLAGVKSFEPSVFEGEAG